MINVGKNFGRLTKCPVCLIEDDTQEHLFKCTKLNNILPSCKEYEHDDIFSNNLEKIEKILNIADTNLRKRENILDK